MEDENMQKGCPKCGRMIDANLKQCPFCHYDFKEINGFFRRIDAEKFLEEDKYAGFVKRIVAGLIDIYIPLIITYLITLLLGLFTNITIMTLYVSIPIFIVLYLFLNATLERSSWHGSIGKRLVRIEVVDEYENPVTFGKAFVGNIAKILNVISFGVGILMCATPPKKQTLGDKVAKTYVLNKINFKQEKNLGFADIGRRFAAFVIDLLIIGVIIFLIFYLGDLAVKNLSFLPEFIVKSEKTIEIILSSVVGLFYFPMYESTKGKSYGKRKMQIKIVTEKEESLHFPLAFVREFLLIFDILTLGFLLPLSNRKRQTLKDMITKTVVIYD